MASSLSPGVRRMASRVGAQEAFRQGSSDLEELGCVLPPGQTGGAGDRGHIEAVELIRRWRLEGLPDEDIATELRAAGLRTARGHAFGAQAVRNGRHSIRLARPSTLAPGEVAVRKVAAGSVSAKAWSTTG